MSSSAKIKTFAAALAVALSVPGAAHAGLSTMEMMDRCKPFIDATSLPNGNVYLPITTFESGTCYGAFVALHGLSRLYSVCLPNGVGVTQMVRVFEAYARQNPEIQHVAFQWTALSAFKPVWPCKEKE